MPLSNLSFHQFQEQHGQSGDRTYEFWYGRAVPKSMPTWVHGILQVIIAQLLKEAGLIAASEVELRVVPDAHPKPDVIAVRKMPRGLYQTEGADVIVEIISAGDDMQYLREKCRKYQEWGCNRIYKVNPSDRSVSEWQDESFCLTGNLAGVPVERIWEELDQAYCQNSQE